MKKTTKPIKKTKISKDPVLSKVNDMAVQYNTVRAIPALKDFTYLEFKKIADKAPFSLAEWSSILHVSERTLQRYAKNNSSFASINAERALQIEKVLKEGKTSFGNTDNFYNWLKRNPIMPEGALSIASLSTLDGIEKVLTQLGRIQQGLFA